MLIIKNKKDIAAYLETSPVVIETKRDYEQEDPGSFAEIEKELAKLIATGDGSPDFGEDWEKWLADNVEELLSEAIDIVM